MHESGPRVVLLARPGGARERLLAALNQAGAQLVLDADPTQLDPAALSEAQPRFVVVVLDAMSEPVVEKFDAVLQDPSVEVMFEEAEVAARREGWDAARWIRHLSAKLHRHSDVLPPGATADAPTLDDVQVASRDTAPGLELAFDTAPAPVSLADANSSEPARADESDVAELLAPFEAPAHPLSDAFSAGVEPGTFAGFDPVTAELADLELNADQIINLDFQLDGASPDDDVTSGRDALVLDFDLDGGLALPGDTATSDGLPAQAALNAFDPLNFEDALIASAQSSGGDADASPAPAMPSFDRAFSLDEMTDEALPAAPAVTEPARTFGHMNFELADDDTPMSHAGAPAGNGATRAHNLDELDRRIASLELVADEPSIDGAVLVLAGVGGPDAVRQLLASLTAEFRRPVVVRQKLEVGRYDRLVTQMQRASALPVELACAGIDLQPATVYMLPDGLGIARGESGLVFAIGADAFDALPAADSAFVLLSGSDPSAAEQLADARWSSALRAGQAPEGCYDPTASNALAAQGGLTGQPAELAARLVERWGAR